MRRGTQERFHNDLHRYFSLLPALCAVVVIGCSTSGEGDSDGKGTGGDGTEGGLDTTSEGGPGPETDPPGGASTDDLFWESDSFDECAAVSEAAQNKYQPLDIIFTIDNTPSMLDEINEVRANMNFFSEHIIESGLDAHIVLISCLPGDCGSDKFHGICIDGPLGREDGCTTEPPDDTNLPAYFHVSQRVPSVKGLGLTLDTYDEWKFMLRDGSKKHFVIVSDDTDETDAATFNQRIAELDDGNLSDYQFNGIFAYMSKDAACAVSSSEACCTYAAPEGNTDSWDTVYADLVDMTGGVSSDLCLQDFDPVFEELAHSVIASAELSCAWDIPAPPDGETLDPSLVNVDFQDGEGNTLKLGNIDSAEKCDRVEHAWYYDNPEEPTQIKVCPQTCTWIRSFPSAQIVLQFGCATEGVTIV